MSHYKDITFFTNKRRIELLIKFRKLTINYFNNSRFEWMADSAIEEPEARQARAELNRILGQAHKVIVYAGVQTVVTYTPPAMVGGYVQNIDLVQNMFLLYRFRVPTDQLMDCVERAIGIYEHDTTASLIRTVNPFFWLNKVIKVVASVPFTIIGIIGFDQKKAESSFIGRVSKVILYLVTLSASILTILQLLGYLEAVKGFVKNIVRL